MAKWDQLERLVRLPENVKEDEYRDTLSTVYTSDGKLHFFGKKGVDPTNQNWHETILVGSFESSYDVVNKNWLPIKSVTPVDKDPSHRGHLFAVRDHIFLFIYSKCGGYYKLFLWRNGNFATEIKIEDSCSKGGGGESGGKQCPFVMNLSVSYLILLQIGPTVIKATDNDFDYRFYPTGNGFYATFESDNVYVVRLTIDLDNSGQVRGAKCACVAKWNMLDSFRMGGHVTAFGYSSDHRKIWMWGGEEMCGFWWKPDKVHIAQLEPGKVVDVKPVEGLQIDQTPPYAYSGPQKVVQWQNTLLMLGGSSQVGIGQTKDNPEIWAFDLNNNKFRKLKADLPPDVGGYRRSIGFDFEKGDLYVCDKLKGIFKINVKNLL